MVQIRSTREPQALEAAIGAAVAALRAGEVVAVPTETVYGLAANALDAEAVQRIFSLKGRPSHNPIIVHVSSLKMARSCAREWPEIADRLARAFWPGPLTLVLPKATAIPDLVTAGGDTVAIRWPSHPVTEAIIQRCGFPLAAPSANVSGRLSPTSAEHVQRGMGDRLSLIIDGGASAVGVESTVLDISVSPPQILRPGMIQADSIAALVGPVGLRPTNDSGALRSPGQLLKHYSPKARLWIWNGKDAALEAEIAATGGSPNRVYFIGWGRVPPGPFRGVAKLARDATAAARALYSELHRADETGAELIIIEEAPEGSEWMAIQDRLKRAAAQD